MSRCWPLPILWPCVFCVLLTNPNFGITQTLQLLESLPLEFDGPSSVFSDLDSAFCIGSNCTHPQQRLYIKIHQGLKPHHYICQLTKLLFTGPSFNNLALTQCNFFLNQMQFDVLFKRSWWWFERTFVLFGKGGLTVLVALMEFFRAYSRVISEH